MSKESLEIELKPIGYGKKSANGEEIITPEDGKKTVNTVSEVKAENKTKNANANTDLSPEQEKHPIVEENLKPADHKVLYTVAKKLYTDCGEHEGALSSLEKLSEREPTELKERKLTELKDVRDVKYFYELGDYYEKKALAAEDSKSLHETHWKMAQGYFNQAGHWGQNALGLWDLYGTPLALWDLQGEPFIKKNVEEAVIKFQAAAKENNPDAQYNLGRCYEEGWGVEKDIKEARRLYDLASNKGHIVAKYYLGRYYLTTQAEMELQATGMKLILNSAESENVEAQHFLGSHFECFQNYLQAIRFYKLAADQGYAKAQYNLGRFYADGFGVPKDIKESLRLNKLAADQGYVEAQYTVGLFYENGAGLPEKNIEEALRLYQLAADQGHPRAAYLLAPYYKSGIGVPPDEKKAINLCKQAATAGLPDAQKYLADYYFGEHDGVKRDLKQASEWYSKFLTHEKYKRDAKALYNFAVCCELIDLKKWPNYVRDRYAFAANAGHAQAQNRLGELFQLESPSNAVYWYEKSAEQNNADAQYNLGVCSEQGIGTPKDSKQAVKWYQEAEAQDHPRATCALGLCYEQGKGVTAELKMAISLYRKAADNKNAEGFYHLGRCYEAGLGLEKNEQEAVRLFELAAKQKYIPALNHLADDYFAKQNFTQAREWYQIFHDKEPSKTTTYRLGRCYELGGAQDPDGFKMAAQLYSVAALLGSSEAFESLGHCYLHGRGVDQDRERALQNYEASYNAGNVQAYNTLGLLYLNSSNPEEQWHAEENFRAAMERDNVEAMYNLALCIRRGFSIKAKEGEELSLLHQAALLGHVKAMADLGDYYFKGEGTEKNVDRALNYYLRAEKAGSKECYAQIGHCYFYGGDGVKKDRKKAVGAPRSATLLAAGSAAEKLLFVVKCC